MVNSFHFHNVTFEEKSLQHPDKTGNLISTTQLNQLPETQLRDFFPLQEEQRPTSPTSLIIITNGDEKISAVRPGSIIMLTSGR